MAGSILQSLSNYVNICLEVNKNHFARNPKHLPVGMFERGTSDNGILASLDHLADGFPNSFQPRSPVVVA